MKQQFKTYAHIIVGKAIKPEGVLYGAVGEVNSVLVVGTTPKGDLYLASSHKIEDAIILAQRALDDLKERMK